MPQFYIFGFVWFVGGMVSLFGFVFPCCCFVFFPPLQRELFVNKTTTERPANPKKWLTNSHTFLARKHLLRDSRARRPRRGGIFKMPQTPTSSWKPLCLGAHPPGHERTDGAEQSCPCCRRAGPKAALPKLTHAGTPGSNTHTAFQTPIKYQNARRQAGAFVRCQDRSSLSVCPRIYRHIMIYVLSAVAAPACYISIKKCCGVPGGKLTLAPSCAQESGKGSESTR